MAATALHLLRMGAQVTLVDAWGPGNSRSSSGGETRIIRSTYGTDKIYFEMVKRTLEILRESERRWNRRLYHNIGCLVFTGADDTYAKSSLPLFKEVGLPVEELSSVQAAKRWPQINFKGIRWMVHEKDAGYLTARRNCAWVLDGFLQEGGAYRQREASPGRTNGKALAAVKLSDNSELAADYFVFALRPWLGKVFPDVIGERIRPSRQQVLFFGTKPGDAAFDETTIPCWINRGTPPFYGIPANEWRGFKIADDSRGPDFDPTNGERVVTPEAVREARSYLAIRFPGMERAPLLESRRASTKIAPITISSWIFIRRCRTSCCWAEARVMATSTGPRSANAQPAFCWGRRRRTPSSSLPD